MFSWPSTTSVYRCIESPHSSNLWCFSQNLKPTMLRDQALPSLISLSLIHFSQNWFHESVPSSVDWSINPNTGLYFEHPDASMRHQKLSKCHPSPTHGVGALIESWYVWGSTQRKNDYEPSKQNHIWLVSYLKQSVLVLNSKSHMSTFPWKFLIKKFIVV